MVPAKKIRFDCYLNRFKAKNEREFSNLIARQLSYICDVDPELLSELILDKVQNADLQFVDGAAVFDIKSSCIKTPAVLLATLDAPLTLGEEHVKPFDVVAGVVSDSKAGTTHLQKLSKVSRLIRSKDFCDTVRACENVDSMELLFTPAHKLVNAA